jgi:hypothetical protein
MLDLKTDKTDIKFKELEFIETLVGDNYLSYHAIEKKTNPYLVRPLDAFKDTENTEDFSLTNFFENIDLSYATQEQKEQFAKAREILTRQNIDIGLSKLQNLPEDISSVLSKILPLGASEMSIMELAEYIMGKLKLLEEDKTVYKDLRNIVDLNINDGKYTVEYDNIDFNDDLKNSVLQKSFTDYVNANLNPNGDKVISNYDFFIKAYFTLDLLGISKEPSKNVRFRNVMNDGYHGYYGAFCDYVVSEDQGFLKKTRAMYRLLNIQTKVIHIDEFIPFFKILSNNFEQSTDIFFDLINNDLKSGLVLESKPSIRYNRQTTTIKPAANYLGYFNRIDRIKQSGQDFILLSRTTHNYSYFSFYREYEGVVNKAVKLFGPDIVFKGKYDWPGENKEINDHIWAGRFWDLGKITVLLEINKGTEELCLQITNLS